MFNSRQIISITGGIENERFYSKRYHGSSNQN